MKDVLSSLPAERSRELDTIPIHSVRKRLFVFIAIITLSAIIASTALLRGRKAFSPTTTPAVPTSTPEPRQAYTNAQYGFSFKYPPGWKGEEINTLHQDVKFWILFDDDERPASNQTNLLDYYPNPQERSDFMTDYFKGFHIAILDHEFSSQELSRSGPSCNLEHEGCTYYFTSRPETFLDLAANTHTAVFADLRDFGQTLWPYSYMIFNRDGTGWIIIYPHSDFSGNHDPVFDQILSTFKFLDPSVSEDQVSTCQSNSDCIVVPYSHCCGQSKRAINKKYKLLYESHAEWQKFDNPEVCSRIGICPRDSHVTKAVCNQDKRCDLVY